VRDEGGLKEGKKKKNRKTGGAAVHASPGSSEIGRRKSKTHVKT
jgi:hypothetical protein